MTVLLYNKVNEHIERIMLDSNFGNITINNRKTLLVFDWSNLLFRSLNLHQMFSGRGQTTYARKEDIDSFIFKFCQDVLALIKIFTNDLGGSPQVLICCDSKDAWRKSLLINDDGTSEYKKGREKDPNIDWEAVYTASDNLLHIFQKRLGCTVAMCDHAEADDLVCMTKETVMSAFPDYNVVIVSADADLRQLLTFNKETRQFCIVYNTTTRAKSKTRRLYVQQEFKDWLDEPDKVDLFFESIDTTKNYIKSILEMNTFIELFVENPNEIVLSKVFCGDTSDVVPAIYSYYKNGKQSRITLAKYKKIVEMLNITDVSSLLENVVNLPSAVEKVCKISPTDVDFNERVLLQRRLVELNSKLFPKEIAEYKDTITYMIRNSEPIKRGTSLRAVDVLKGTAYETADKKNAIVADVIKDLNQLTVSVGNKPLF